MITVQPRGIGSFSSRQLCAAAGISYRQLDYWCRQGYISPSISPAHGSGSWRRFSNFDVACARTLGRLAALGCDHALFPAVVHQLEIHDRFGLAGDFLAISPAGRVEVLSENELAIAALDFGAVTVVALDEVETL